MALTRLELWRPNSTGTAFTRPGRIDIAAPFAAMPLASNSGLNVQGVSTSDLTVVNGDLTVSNTYLDNGGKLDRLWVKGHFLYTATREETFTNCLIEGRSFSGSAPWESIIRARNGSAPNTARPNFVNCTIRAVQPDVGITAAMGERLGRFYRCDISLGSDLLDFWIPSVPQVEGCYLHDYSFWNADPKHTNDSQHPGWSHNDLVQHDGGSDGGYIIGNTFDIRAAAGVGDVATLQAWAPDRNYGAGVMLTPGHGRVTNMTIKNNWFLYGEVHIAMPTQGGGFDNGNSWEVSGNRHNDRPHGYGPYSGQYSRQYVRWGRLMGPGPTSLHDNLFYDDPSTLSTLRNQGLPSPVVVGGDTSTGQYIVATNSPTYG